MDTKAARRVVAVAVMKGWVKFAPLDEAKGFNLRTEFKTGGLRDYRMPLMPDEYERPRERR